MDSYKVGHFFETQCRYFITGVSDLHFRLSYQIFTIRSSCKAATL